MWLDFEFAKAKLEFYDRSFSGKNRLTFQSANFSPYPVRIAHSFGLHAYSISPKGARALLDHCLSLRSRFIPFPGTSIVIKDTGIDCVMCEAYNSMQAFVCIPPLVISDEEQGSVRVELDQDQLHS
jgi:hypothetical protein